MLHLVAAMALATVLQKQTQELVDAIAPGKIEVWKRLLDDRAVITAEDGTLQTKQEFLKDFHALPPGVSGSISVIDFHVVDHGGVAIANYVMDEHETYHGHPLHCQYRATDTWQKSASGWRLIASQILALRTDPPSIELDRSLEEQYVGRYALAPDITYEIRREGSGLEGRRNGHPWERLLAEAPDVLFVPGQVRYRKIFLRDAAHKITGFADRREAWDLVWERVK